MMATMSSQAPNMPHHSHFQSAPKRPRLSLKIQATSVAGIGRSAAASMTPIDTSSPTAFSTLSIAYAAAIEQSSPRSMKAPATILSVVPSPKPTSLRLVTNASIQTNHLFPSERTQTPCPPISTCPEAPSSAYTISTPTTRAKESETFTFTSPFSAHASNDSSVVFSIIPEETSLESPYPRRRATVCSPMIAPYTQSLSLHSILRNSPLPRRTSQLSSNRSASVSFCDAPLPGTKTAKRVCYNTPLTQTITTNKYTKSHIDLLSEEASPCETSAGADVCTLDTSMVFTGDETKDGGQTPGPFEDIRRRMAGLGDVENSTDNATNGAPGMKRKRKEKSRRWVWTIGNTEEYADVLTETKSAVVERAEDDSVLLLRPDIYVPVTSVDMSKKRKSEAVERPGSAHSI